MSSDSPPSIVSSETSPSTTHRPIDSTAANKRLRSLDQFRGYTVLGMLIVNYFGSYTACPQLWKHTNDYMSFADTIMPQFLFAAGFSLRLTVGRQLQQGRTIQSYSRILRRLLGLVLIALVVYTVGPRASSWEQLKEIGFWGAIREPLKSDWFQTLMHIAVTSLWIIPVIHRRIWPRVNWMIGSSILHVMVSHFFNYTWCNTQPTAIDGGPLGFLTWTIPAILGTIACDWFVPDDTGNPSSMEPGTRIGWPILTALGLMLLGYCFSCGTRFYDVIPTGASIEPISKLAPDPVLPDAERRSIKMQNLSAKAWLAEPPFIKPPDSTKRQWNYWMMSQRAGTLSYLVFASGFSLAVFVLFYIACDIGKLELPIFRTFGVNALAAYVLHDLTSNAVKPFFPKDSPSWYAFTGLLLFCWITWLFLRSLERQKIFLRV